MPHFVYDNTNLDFPKNDLNALPVGADAAQYVVASNWNTLCQAVVDVKSQLRGGKFFGLEAQASDPNPSGITNYLWLSNTNILTLEAGVTTIQFVPASRLITAGAGLTGTGSLAANITLALETLSPSPVGTFSNATVTVDEHGRVTSASAGAIGYSSVVNNATPLTARAILRVDGTNLTAVDDAGDGATDLALGAEITVDKVTADEVWAKTHAAFTGSESKRITGAIQTSDGTATTLATIALNDTTVYSIQATIIGRAADGSQRAMYSKKALVYREGGAATLQGAVQDLHADIETNAALVATIDVNGNNARVRVTGLAATLINWAATIEIQAISGNA